MPKKFLSFLGAIPYKEAIYYFDAERTITAAPTPFVQKAILEKGIPDWKAESDKVLIFTTKEALKNNYLNRIISFNKESQQANLKEKAGLESELKQLQQKGQIKHFDHILISNGNLESEIWEIFQTVFEYLDQGDEVYFDITFGFRFLPMFGLVLLNYARVLKGVHIKAVLYGNYEAGRAEQQAALNLKEQESPIIQPSIVQAPVINLMPFVELQDWTHAARTFIDLGNAGPLAQLVQNPDKRLSQELLKFSNALLTCRGGALMQDLDIDLLKNIVTLTPTQPEIKKQLKPLLKNIQQKIAPFEKANLQNGFAAVEWCIQHGMIQQGITFLQETLKSMVIERTIGMEHLNEYVFRFAANGALNKLSNPGKTISEKNRHMHSISDDDMRSIYNQMYRWVNVRDPLADLYMRLTGRDGFRNDINHCGFKNNYKSADELKGELIDLYKSLKVLNL